MLPIPFIAADNIHQATVSIYPIGDPWATDLDGNCKAAFSVSHNGDGIYLTFSVTESMLQAQKRAVNGPVHLDNCVEFFIAFNNEAQYYNFEFNCLGSIKAAFGLNRQQRVYLPSAVLQPVSEQLNIKMDNHSPGKTVHWEIGIILPVSTFIHHQIISLSGQNCAVNFTKCGDELPNAHYLSWANIPTPRPDFHQRDFFGRACFEPAGILVSILNNYHE